MIPPTNYNRINVILPKEDKELINEWCKTNRYTLTAVLRQALKEWFKKKGIELS